MFQVNRQGVQSNPHLSAENVSILETAISEWYRSIEQQFVTGVNCLLSLWSNEFYSLGAVASLTVEGNLDDELVIDIEVHRCDPNENQANVAAQVARERGVPLAEMPSRKISVDKSGSITEANLGLVVTDIRSFLDAQSQLVVDQTTAMAEH
jgi:hypothetical protein